MRISDWSSDVCSSDLPLDFGASLSPQPHSTWPRIREPAATVSVSALMSPLSAPDSSSSTREADSTLPSSSPATITFLALTPPLSLAPFSMVRSPCTLTSPLNLPAMRTWPAPSILPSMVRSARSEEHTSELQSLMRISYAVFCLQKKTNQTTTKRCIHQHY